MKGPSAADVSAATFVICNPTSVPSLLHSVLFEDSGSELQCPFHRSRLVDAIVLVRVTLRVPAANCCLCACMVNDPSEQSKRSRVRAWPSIAELSLPPFITATYRPTPLPTSTTSGYTRPVPREPRRLATLGLTASALQPVVRFCNRNHELEGLHQRRRPGTSSLPKKIILR